MSPIETQREQSASELLEDLTRTGARLSVDGERLRVRAVKGALTPDLRALLAEKKSQLIALLRQRSVSRPGTALRPDPASRFEPFPLTEIQEAYWVGRKVAEGTPLACYTYFELSGVDLDVDRLESTWRRLIDHHDMLRAVVLEDGRQQVLEEAPPWRIERVDLRGLDPAETEERLAELRGEMSHQALPLEQWPLFDIRATRLDERRTRIHFGLDLFMVDGSNIFQLFRQWRQLYEDPQRRLAPFEISFRDYVLAERADRESAAYQRSLDYWKRRAAALPPPPVLPLATSPSALREQRFERRADKIPGDVWQSLKHRAEEAGVSPSVMLCAAYAETLAMWSKERRFTLNLTVFRRQSLHPQVRDLLGEFTSTLLLEFNGSQGDFESRAQRLQEQLWQDLEHYRVSGVEVLRQLKRQGGGAFLETVPVVYTSVVGTSVTPGEGSPYTWVGELEYAISQTPQVWIDYQVVEVEDGLLHHWDALAGLFPPGLLDGMFGAYCDLLRRLANDGALWKARSLSLLPEPMAEQWRRYNSTGAPLSEELLHTLFRAQAERRPDQTAVVADGRSLTYRELLDGANRLGGRLRELGAAPEELVAVVMDKGWEQVVGVLGILEAGAAYVPIDPELPESRRSFLLEHGEVRLAVTQPEWEERLEWPGGVTRVVVSQATLESFDSAAASPVRNHPQDLAYVIYTSGSTGQPKGVAIDHRGAVNTVVDVNRRFQVSPSDRILALSALSFDLSVYDIFGALAAGATLVIPRSGSQRDPEHWLDLIGRQGVTVWNSVPALMEMLVEYVEGRGGDLPTLRLALLSGDWIPVSLPDRVRRLAPEVALISLGGATEASIWSIFHPVGDVAADWASIPYGRPLDNQGFYVLDENLEPRPAWVPGELYIGGVGLAKGYWRDEEKTALQFFEHPATGERLYRTGDLGRLLPDGDIEFLGREDLQVKIRGHRIELGEIETVLQRHPAVRAAAVTVRGGRHQARLVGFLVPEAEAAARPDPWSRPTGMITDGYLPPQMEGIELDPAKRAERKRRQLGIRDDGDSRPAVRFDLDDDRRARFARRRSHRLFLRRPVPGAKLGGLLACLGQWPVDQGLPKYQYPSAGHTYPIQAYLHVRPDRVDGVDAGYYYYHPGRHRLERLGDAPDLDRRIHAPNNQAIFESAAFSIFLVAQRQAIEPLYGGLARDLCLLEAGYMGQLLMTEAAAHAMGLCPIGAVDADRLRGPLELDDGHVVVHSLLGGAVEAREGVLFDEAPSPGSGHGDLRDDVRSLLETTLPEYMVPSDFVVLDALPLTANGKVDRKALAQRLPDVETQPSAPYTAPRSDLELSLAEMVRDVVGLDKVGVYDSFFEIGVNSVHVVQIHRRLVEEVGCAVPIVEMFRYPTIALLAERMSGEDEKESQLPSDEIRHRSRRQARALKDQQQRLRARRR